ncbi:hypothetical protein D9615_005083 [Tricholomella constricta]|uniref:3-beta hydroxysteroid dehydrogenase/isomerase domain-containing protein n=1 Tax=Tricholomella constricta TaxID=117010 RepID=A0A8H5HH17_9AGAR|nr:hypothetical protein D9615_005083 [Tricholomella constricta]
MLTRAASIGGSVSLVLVVLLVIYVRLNNYRLTRLPKEAAAVSPVRWTPESVRNLATQLKSPHVQLPPRTGRRYIVVGGAGFLGGWIVSALLERGEDPKSIRILDIRPPLREDIISAQANGVRFIQVDVSDPAAVDAAFAAPWPSTATPLPELTVFHTAANIRFYERHKVFLSRSEAVNVAGTQHILNSARAAGASILVYTSSGSVAVRRSRFFLWPWQSAPPYFVQVITDDDSALPKHHDQFFSNYAVSKIRAERIVRTADKSPTGNSEAVLRTGCIRPGNGVFGPRGDMLCGAYLVRQTNPTWISSILQSFCYVENCALAHLCYEARLADLLPSSPSFGKNPDIGGQAFVVADPGPTPTYGDVYTALETLTEGECTFPNLPPTLMLLVATVIESYYLLRHFLLEPPPSHGASGFLGLGLGKALGKLLPPINGDLVNLQPSLFALTSVHLIFDDSRARLPPAAGGLGYTGAWTTFEGLCKTVEEHRSGVGRAGRRSDLAGVSLGFGLGKAQRAVAEVNEKVVDGLGVDAVKILSTK